MYTARVAATRIHFGAVCSMYTARVSATRIHFGAVCSMYTARVAATSDMYSQPHKKVYTAFKSTLSPLY